ncbi:MAG: hypothetical protein ACP5F6_03685 [Microbacter sp.]
MERKTNLLLILFFMLSSTLFGQQNPLIYQAYIRGDMNQWKSVMDSMAKHQPNSQKELLDLINYQYGYIGWAISAKHASEAAKYLKLAEEELNSVHDLSMQNAYKAAFIGFKIGLSPLKAFFIGLKSLEYAQESVRLDPNNPFGYMQLGNIAYYTPKIFGGSKPEALQHYLDALRMMEKNPGFTVHNWNYLNLLATLIQAYMEFYQYDNAKAYCKKTLAIEPNFDWVKNHLCPQLHQKITF